MVDFYQYFVITFHKQFMASILQLPTAAFLRMHCHRNFYIIPTLSSERVRAGTNSSHIILLFGDQVGKLLQGM